MVNEGVEDLTTGRLGAFLATAVADVLEGTAFVLELKVVPVFATDEDAGVTVFQLKVMDALEDLREGFTAFEVQVTVIGSLGQAAAAVVDADEVFVGAFSRPTRADRQGRVELTFDFTDVETDAECRPGERRGKADGQRQFRPAPELVY
ncbi:hypothetical protein D9M71_646380 [compost metagenome]